MDHLALVHGLRAARLELARLDPHAGMPLCPPAPAPEDALARVERRIGRRLPRSYREFLAVHDGWPQFFQGAALLGTTQLARGTFVDIARMVLDDLPDIDTTSIVPFGIDRAAEVILAWDFSRPLEDGEVEVVFWVNEIGGRVGSFWEVLALVSDVIGAAVAERRSRFGRGRGGRPAVAATAVG